MTEINHWGPWVDHDGKGCPIHHKTMIQVRGVYTGGRGFIFEGMFFPEDCGKWVSWSWEILGFTTKIMSYRLPVNRHVELMKKKANALNKISPEALKKWQHETKGKQT
jgi:hypothetical protein